MRLADILQHKLVIPRLHSRTKWDAIEELVDKLVEAHELRILDRARSWKRPATQRSRSTGLDGGLALRTPARRRSRTWSVRWGLRRTEFLSSPRTGAMPN